MIIKNLKKYFTFEVQVLDDKNVRRRFRASNYQSTTRVKPFICTMPMRLDDGWNQIQFNLSDFTRRAYGTNYIETLRVQVRQRRSDVAYIQYPFSIFNNYFVQLIYRFMPIVEFDECISRIVCTRKTNYRQSSSSICQFRKNNFHGNFLLSLSLFFLYLKNKKIRKTTTPFIFFR